MANLFTVLLENALDQYLKLDPEGRQGFADLEGKVVAVELLGINQTLYLFPNSNGIRVSDQYDGEPDTWMRGTPLSLAKLGMSDALGGGFFSGNVEIRGDVDTGKRFKELLDGIQADWEEPLAQLGGDVFAHQVGNAIRGTRRWASKSVARFGDNLSEYIKEEARLLPTRIELENMYEDIDELHMATDRLEARLQRLKTAERDATDHENKA